MREFCETHFKGAVIGAGIFYIGYRIGQYRAFRRKGFSLKSFLKDESDDSSLVKYCLAHSSPLHPAQQKLINETVKHSKAIMMGAPEVIQVNMMIIQAIGGY
jgi:hypothetical protein